MADFMKMAPTTSDALVKRHKESLNCNTLGTLDFFTLSPVYVRKIDPGESIDIDVSSYTKLNPMNKPVLGNYRVVTRAFFVPNYTIMDGYNEFTSQTPFCSNGNDFIIQRLCYTYLNDLYRIFVQDNTSGYSSDLLKDVSGASPSEHPDYYDVSFYNEIRGEVRYYDFTSKGRKLYNVLVALGYKIFFPQSDTDVMEIDRWGEEISVMPILAFCKVYYDWYALRQFDNFERLRSYLFRPAQLGGVFYSWEDLYDMLAQCLLCGFEDNYFTSQFDNPYGANTSDMRPNINMSDVDIHINNNAPGASRYGITDVVSDRVGTPMLQSRYGSSSSVSSTNVWPVNVTQYILDGLKSATDYVTAHRIAGNRIIDQFLIQFGYRSSYDNMMISKVVGHFDDYVNIGEVNATTENEQAGQVLGDFAGRGHAIGQNNRIHFDNDENQANRGYLLILSYVEPQTNYASGIRRELFDTRPLDEYNGRFDGKGPQATYKAELYGQMMTQYQNAYSLNGGSQKPDQIFGWMPRYSHYKIAYDSLQGDFARPKYYEIMRQWHNYRDFDSYIKRYAAVPDHDLDFCLGKDTQYNHVFAVTDAGIDNFVVNFFFKVDLWTTKLPLWQDYNYDHEDEHKKLLMQVNGSRID